MAQISQDISKAVALLKQGELVAIPTETVYGLAANALDPEAIAKIFETKNRPAFDPLIVHALNKAQAEELIADWGPHFDKLYQRFSPGPISYVLPKTSKVPDLVTAGHSTVALRFPEHQIARQLLENLEFPLAAPSANLFGKVSPVQAHHVDEQLGNRIKLILDGGKSQVGLESTIIDLSQELPVVLRLGGLSLEEIEDCLGTKVKHTKSSSSNPKAPGMLSAHYSPGIPVLFGNLNHNLAKVDRSRTGIISFCKKVAGVPETQQRVLSPKCDLKEAASKLFEALRSFNKSEVDVILAAEFPAEGLGRAINDRLKRASVA